MTAQICVHFFWVSALVPPEVVYLSMEFLPLASTLCLLNNFVDWLATILDYSSNITIKLHNHKSTSLLHTEAIARAPFPHS